jgi:sortase (surface protein transpeptidase)
LHIAVNLPAGVDNSARQLLALRSTRARILILAAALVGSLAVSVATGAASGATAALDLGAELRAAPQAQATHVSELAVARAAPAASAAELEPVPAATPEPTQVAPPPPPPPPAPDYVARIAMPRLGINHYIEQRGVSGGYLESPYDGVYAVAWYSEYNTPGRGGNTLFSAHETWNYSRGPFYLMHQAQVGDVVTVVMTSGKEYQYVVFSNKRHPADVNMGPIIWPNVPAGEEWATFMTCGGRFVPTGGGLGEYLDRDVVIARRVLG